ncbi:general substrate transporter [Aspergillus sergii]|uniref:General substrate transporter n=1 Tax=Aspergillus sergii TaxID=1034303 RepID=A0A5N6X5G9_9EURO|nr:general substrate transporter [Aspergillus sergii]
MTIEKIAVPIGHDLRGFNLNDDDTTHLINQARQSDAADKLLTVGQALRKYRKAVLWSMLLSTSLIMEGYDLGIINAFFGQAQFKERFGVYNTATGEKLITPAWQSGLSNSSLVGQLFGLIANSYCQDKFGARLTMMFFMAWMTATISIVCFAPSLSVLAWGEAMCGVPWGVFQTLSTSYASEVVPSVLRPYVTTYVCLCWGAGKLLSSGVIRAVSNIKGDLGWQIPFFLQWIWPVPLFISAYLAPESPWNAVRRGKLDLARKSLTRLTRDTPERTGEVEAALAYIKHITALEEAETAEGRLIECFRGSNLRRTEINCVVWGAQTFSGMAMVSYAVVFLQAAGFSEVQSLNLNISLAACSIVGGIICWLLFPYFGRVTLYMGGMTFMFLCSVTIGGLGWAHSTGAHIAIGILLVLSNLSYMITIGPAAYPIVSETPSGRLRYKTLVIGRFMYNVCGVIINIITPRMISSAGWNWGARTGLFYAGTNLLCNIWCFFRLPETKDRSFGEIDILFENRVPARKFKSTKVDQFSLLASTDLKGEDEAGIQTVTQIERVA